MNELPKEAIEEMRVLGATLAEEHIRSTKAIFSKYGIQGADVSVEVTEETPTHIDEIIRFNTDRGLDKLPTTDFDVVAYIIEEILELKDFTSEDARIPGAELANAIDAMNTYACTDEEAIDAFADIVVYCIGHMYRKGYNPELVLDEVAKEINSGVGEIIDGKFTKSKRTYKADYTKALR